MSLQNIFGSCFPITEEPEQYDKSAQRKSSSSTPRRSHMRSLSDIFRMVPESAESSPDPTRTPPSPIPEDGPPALQRPKPVRSYTSPVSTRDAHRSNLPYGPTLTVHDAFLANELLGSSSSLENGQYSFLHGAFVPRSSSRASQHTRRASVPGDMGSRRSPSPYHMHSRAAQSLGNLNVDTATLSPFLRTPSPVHRPSSPSVTSIDTRGDSVSIATTATSFETETIQTVTTIVSEPATIEEVSQGESDVSQDASMECKDTLDRIKLALEEKQSLERRLQELEKLITGKRAQGVRVRSLSTSRSEELATQPEMNHHDDMEEQRRIATPTPTVHTVTEIATDDSEAPLTPRADIRRSVMTHETDFEDDLESHVSFHRPAPPPPQPQRQRPQLPQLQTSIPFAYPPPLPTNERPTPSSASRITSAVSRIANWIFGDDEYPPHQQSSNNISSPITYQRPQHASCQQFQFIQAHHLQLTPTTPTNYRRTAHMSVPANGAITTTITPTPIVGYQQRWRPRNVEDVDPVPPYFEQDPNPSPGFVFFPQNSLLTPLPTPTSPAGVSIATQMYAHAI